MMGASRSSHSPRPLVRIAIAASAAILFAASSARHALFQSTAWDLGIFDQATYLISRGLPPISSFLNFHILGDHAALIFYLLALPYRLRADVHWLLGVQAIALAVGALPVWQLARQAGLKATQADAIAVAYLLHPLLFNVNLFDFHPDTLALPAFFWAVLAARNRQLWAFCLALLFVLSCKAVFSLTVMAVGLWLLVGERRPLTGTLALVAGAVWYAIATQLLIPAFSNEAATVGRHLTRFSHLGSSFGEIAQNLALKPGLWLGATFNGPNFSYLALLLLPAIWGLSGKHLSPLVGAIPALAMNLLSNASEQKDLLHQYSLPILPFLFLAAISALGSGAGLVKKPKTIILWALLAFFALGKVGYFGSRYLESLDTWQAARQAIARVSPSGSVFTSAEIAPHLTHRPAIQLATFGSESIDLTQFDCVLLNQRHPGWESSPELAAHFIGRLRQTPDFQLTYERDEVFLFQKSPR